MTKQECETLLASIRDKIAQQGRIVDARLIDKELQLVALLKTYEE